MSGEPDSEGQEKNAKAGGIESHVSKLDARQKAYQRAQQAYEAAKRLGKRLSEAVGRSTTSEWITAIFTVVIAGATIWNGIVVKSSLGILQGQLDEMKGSSVQADKTIAQLSRQTSILEADQRPWVGLMKIELTDVPGAYGIWFQNSGKSPALKVSIDVNAWSAKDGPNHIPNARCESDCLVRDIPMMPGFAVGLRAPQIGRAIVDPKSEIWLIARVDYLDTSGAPHEFGLCFIASPLPGKTQRDCPVEGSNYAK